MSRFASNDLRIELDERTYSDLQRELRDLPGAVERATVAAINRTLTQGRTLIVDRITELLNVKSRAEIRKRVSVPRGGKATQAKPIGRIRVGKNRMGLILFGAKDTRKKKGKGSARSGRGVIVQIYKGGPTKILPQAFIAKYRGKPQVLERKEGTGGLVKTGRASVIRSVLGKRVPRLPIIPKVGPSPADVFDDNPAIEREAKDKIQAVLRNNVLSQIDRLLNRRKIDRPEALAA